MLDILRDYLNGATSPEVVQMLSDAHELFDQLGLDGYDDNFMQFLMVDDDADPGITEKAVIDLTRAMLLDILKQHGISVIDETPIPVLNDYVSTLVQLPNFDRLPDVLAITQQYLNANEIFAEVVALLTPRSAEDALVSLDFVSQLLIQQIRALAAGEKVLDEDEQARVAQQQRLERFKRFMDFKSSSSSLIQTLVAQGVMAGFPFRMYANMVGREFEQMSTEDATLNLLGMAFLSQDGYDNPGAVIAEQLEFLIADPNQVTRVNVAIRETLLKFMQHE